MTAYTNKIMKLFIIPGLAMLMAACASDSQSLLGGMTNDGLQRINLEQVAFVAMKPGTNLGAYSKIHIAQVTVETARGWRPTVTGSRLSLTSDEMDDLKSDIAEQFMTDFSKAFEDSSRLEVVDTIQPGALILTPELVDVKLTSINPESSPGESFTRSAAQATLKLVIRDAGSNQVLARLEDDRETPPRTGGESTTSTYSQLGRIFYGWGNFVSNGLLTLALEAEK